MKGDFLKQEGEFSEYLVDTEKDKICPERRESPRSKDFPRRIA